MENIAVVLIGGVLLGLLVLTALLGLQVWLAGKKSPVFGLLQPAVWAVFALVGNLLPRVDGTAVQGGVAGTGAVVMAILSLLVFLWARRRLK